MSEVKKTKVARTPKQDEEELSTLLNEITPENLAKMPDDVVRSLRKKINPYGRTIQGSDKVLTFSFVDMDKKYKEKFLMTSLIAFINRMNDEWGVPDGLTVVPVEQYNKDPTLIDPPKDKEGKIKVKGKVLEEYKQNWKQMQKRCIVKEFLGSLFQYDPEKHVRSSYLPNPSDAERTLLDTPAAKLAIAKEKRRDPKFKETMRRHEAKEKIRKSASAASAASASSASSASSTTPDKSVKVRSPPKKKQVSSPTTSTAIVAGSTEKDDRVRETTTNMIPPHDIFHRWRYYQEVNFEEIRGVVTDIYNDKPDFETAVNPYDWHDDDDAADKFIAKHKSEVSAEIFKAHSGKWNIIAPFKKVRKNMRFFNEKTQVLEEIFKQQERDVRLGKDLMQKRIARKKKENIKEVGPDDDAFTKWKKGNKTLSTMGAESINQSSYASDECPEDGIQVDYHVHNARTGDFSTDHFFSQSEAPEWFEDGIEQPRSIASAESVAASKKKSSRPSGRVPKQAPEPS